MKEDLIEKLLNFIEESMEEVLYEDSSYYKGKLEAYQEIVMFIQDERE